MIICSLSVYSRLWAYVNNRGGETTGAARKGLTQGRTAKGMLGRPLSGLWENPKVFSPACGNTRRFSSIGRNRRAFSESFSSYRRSQTARSEDTVPIQRL